ncbi:MAG: hypothetical protein A3D53_03635 [Candidatus Magasanikbacteria bacterium RIFCSPHIGHO2_02_FULL_45_10]|uniref:Methyltransferase FkbM domain-containing protein n=1 Tax=Candidatus Magasanikbacteria bacterium RIFCSPHIGHO2_02_FULL_45_10 TaxID=1798679 RepID=A0A1F6M9P6_9BACT|nr:MAG: hypothetical protein A3D53_03635 [Candidatus Magasanikbacteria bacterium RIFCSPHIGHO2_02_FULL_45_10]
MQTVRFVVNNQPLLVHIRDEADQSIAAEIFSLHEYRRAEGTLRETANTIVDGGAHSGMFTLYARRLNPTVPIIAIEPEKNNLELLKKHLVENNVNDVRVIAGALARDYGKRKLIITENSHNHRLLLPAENSDRKNVVVQGFSLRKIIQLCPNTKIGLLKLDIEGGEYEVFEGATDEDFSRISTIIMEYHEHGGQKHQAIEIRLREQGFGVQTFPSKFNKSMGFLWAVNKRTYAK